MAYELNRELAIILALLSLELQRQISCPVKNMKGQV